MKYVKKPIPVDAWQIDTLELENMGSYPEFIRQGLALERAFSLHRDDHGPCLKIITLEGTMTAYDGDYLIKGSTGEWWFIKKSIFEKTYEEYIPPAPRGDPWVEVVENEDGGATLKFEMHPDDLRTFAKKGIMTVILESIKDIEAEHGVD